MGAPSDERRRPEREKASIALRPSRWAMYQLSSSHSQAPVTVPEALLFAASEYACPISRRSEAMALAARAEPMCPSGTDMRAVFPAKPGSFSVSTKNLFSFSDMMDPP